MNPLEAEVVKEAEIFAVQTPRNYTRSQRPSGTSSPRSPWPDETRPADAAAVGGSLPVLGSPLTATTAASFSPKTPLSLLMAVPITPSECWLVWKFLCDWVKTQLAMEAPAWIPGFGMISLRSQPMEIRLPVFEPEQSFLDKFGIQVVAEKQPSVLTSSLPRTSRAGNAPEPGSVSGNASGKTTSAADAPSASDLFAFSFLEMASCCGSSVDATRAQEWLAAVLNKLGYAMAQHSRVELNIGVGVITCTDRVLERRLLARHTHLPLAMQYEIRTGESVVKRNLMAQASFQMTPTPSRTKKSFLSGGDFSSAIELNPVLDRSKDMPDFSFGAALSPHPPSSVVARRRLGGLRESDTSRSITSAATSSPRSKQLHAKYRKPSSPLVQRTSTSESLPAAADVVQGDIPMLLGDSKERRATPELFDRLSRTLCVEPDQNLSFLLPSNRIGSNFTATATLLMTEKSALQFGQLATVAGGLVFADPPLTRSVTTSTRLGSKAPQTSSEQRYFEYLSDDELINQRYLAPLPSALEMRVVAAAVEYVSGPSDGRIESVLEETRREFVANYYASTKKAILDYLLLRDASCQRLGIPHGVPKHAVLPVKWKWGSSGGTNGCIEDLKRLVIRRGGPLTTSRPSSRRKPPKGQKKMTGVRTNERAGLNISKSVRRKRVQTKLMALLILSNPQVRALQYMWHDLQSSTMLVNLPSLDKLSEAIEPLDILGFERAQLAYATKMKAFVMENWYLKAKIMFESAIRAETFSIHTSEAAVDFRVRHLFDTVATLMSLQIRSLIMASIQAYVNFFELFGAIEEGEGADSSAAPSTRRPTYSGLMTTLVLQEGTIQFHNPLVDIPSRLLNILHNLPKLFYNLGRIETQFEEPLALSGTSSPFLWNVVSQEDDVVLATIRIRAIIEKNLTCLRQLQTDYEYFALTYRYVNSVDCLHLEETSGLETYREEMERVQSTAMQLAIDTSSMQYLGLFSVDCHHVNATLHAELAQWTSQLLAAFQQRTGRLNAELRHQYKEVAARLAKKPLDLYELVDAEAFVNSLKNVKLRELEDKGNVIKQRLRFLLFEREKVHIDSTVVQGDLCRSGVVDAGGKEASLPASFRLSNDLLASTAKTVKWRGHIEKLLRDAEALLVNERARIETMFIAKRTRFQAEIEEFEGEVKGFAKKSDLRHAATYVVQLAKMKDTMGVFRQAMDTIVKEEKKLQWKPTDFSKLDDITEEMAPYEQLWKTAREFREMNSRWLRSNVFELPGKEGIQTLQQMLAVVANVSKVLHLNSAAAAITAETVKKQMTDFRENIRLIVAILNPAMKERHIKEVSELVGIDLNSEESVTLLKLLENGAFDLVGQVVDISSNATQEQHIERALQDIESEWESVCFLFVPSKQVFSPPATLVLPLTTNNQDIGADKQAGNVAMEKTCAENLLVLVEDHLLRLQALSGMPHAGPFTEEISAWQTFTTVVRQVVELLSTNERVWRKLTPLFAAGIVETDSKEATLFAEAARLYLSTHTALLNQPVCKYLFPRGSTTKGSYTPGLCATSKLVTDLENCQKLLESVKENVHVGFESKRSSFSRFYFLSDAELVSALAWGSPSTSTACPSTLWQALSRCFPGVRSVKMNEASEITALVSSLGEQFPIGSPVTTANTPLPIWLAKLEVSMTTILQASIRAAANDLPRKEFRKWCLIWPEQSLIAAIQYTWTLESEQATRAAQPRKAWTELTHTMHENVDAVSKEMKAAAYSFVKATLANVLLLVSQLRDVSKMVLNELGGPLREETAASFIELWHEGHKLEPPNRTPPLVWLSQPRFYYVNNVLSVRMLTSSNLSYGFEYLGNASPAIFVTPLTLRCFHAIAQAASTMAKGACLEGCVGTGKSIICHQLSRLCGRLYVVYQCGNGCPSLASLGNFVKATASSGAWLSIDSLHLLDTASVSVAATLCAQVMAGLAAKQAQCVILGDSIRLKRGAYFMVTRTVRAGWDEPPEGILHCDHPAEDAQFFFRRITVQTPDIEMLAALQLQRGGFVHASTLGKLVDVALGSFDRGFAITQSPNKPLSAIKVLSTRLGNLRAVRWIVERAVELMDLEREQHRQPATSGMPHVDTEEVEDASLAGEGFSSDVAVAISEATAKRMEEKSEHRSVCVALREYLSTMVPTRSLDMIEFVLRDLAAHALRRELRGSKSVLLQARGSSMSAVSSPTAGSQPRWRLEEAVEEFVRSNEDGWSIFGASFGQKAVQLLQTMRRNRTVVISGEMQSGKTSLYGALSRALSGIAAGGGQALSSSAKAPDGELLAPIRCVVLCPRTLLPEQFLGVEPECHANTVFAKLIREAKVVHKADNRTQTWLILDGDLDSLWSEQLLYAAEDLSDGLASHQNGLQLTSGKHVTVPAYLRLVMETTTLVNVSPSFMTRVGALNIGLEDSKMAELGWESVYRIWKQMHAFEFEGFADEIFTILDNLVAETLEASLAFVATNFKSMGIAQKTFTRVQWLLAIFHSSVNQSWRKLRALTSGKPRKTAIHCFYLQALVWGVGHSADSLERLKFHTFLYELILQGSQGAQSMLKRLVTTFFPSGTLFGSATGTNSGEKGGSTNDGGSLSGTGGNSAAARDTLYDYGFSVDFGLKWMRWTDYYVHWMQMQVGAVSTHNSSNTNTAGDGGAETGSLPHPVRNLIVPTTTSTSAICIASQLLLAQYPTMLTGPRDCGKTACGATWMALSATLSQVSAEESSNASLPLVTAESGTTIAEASDDTNTGSEQAAPSETIYSGFYTRASDVLQKFDAVLQRIRVERQARPKRVWILTTNTSDTELDGEEPRVVAPPEAARPSPKRTTFVFVDDLHCINPAKKMDSALELLRMLVEHRAVVDPSSNQLTACQELLPFTTLQAYSGSINGKHDKSDLSRLIQRFLPVALPPLGDSDLSTICTSIASSGIVSLSSDALKASAGASSTSGAGATPAALRDAEQLQAIVVKASIKLFRLLTSSSDFSIISKDALFSGTKMHYNYRVGELLQVVKSVCCEARPMMTPAEKPGLARLWCHESARVLGDRLLDREETFAFHRRVLDIAMSAFGLADDAFFPAHVDGSILKNPTLAQTWFVNDLHFSFIGETSGGMRYRDGYQEVTELPKLELAIERSMMAMYRSDATGTGPAETLEVVLCSYVIKHVLRVSRLMRMSEQPVLLLGARGRKMVTVTRLAAFICKKAAVVYHVPSRDLASSHTVEGTSSPDQRDANAEWNVVLRNALLQSVLARDTSFVFIVKDESLQATSQPYHALDRFLSGHGLPPDVISYDDLDEDIFAILQVAAQRETHEAETAPRGHQTGGQSHPPVLQLHSKRAMLEYFFYHVRRKFQLVLVLAPPTAFTVDEKASRSNSWGPLLWRFPHLLKHCAIDYFEEWPTEALTSIAHKCLSQSSVAFDSQRALQLAQVAVQIYEATRCFFVPPEPCPDVTDQEKSRRRSCVGEAPGIQSENNSRSHSSDGDIVLAWCDRPSPLVHVDMSMLVDQIGLLVSHYERLEHDVTENVARYASGLAFVERTRHILHAEQAQSEYLRPEMEKKTAMRRRMSGSLEKEKNAADKLTRGLELATTLVSAQRERLATVTQEYEDLIQKSRTTFEGVRGSLEVFKEAVTVVVDENEKEEAPDAKTQPNAQEDALTAETSDNGGIEAGTIQNHDSAVRIGGVVDAAMIDKLPAKKPIDEATRVRRHRHELIMNFASLGRIPSSLYQLSECVGVILGIEPIEGHDDMDPDEIIMNYWENMSVRMRTEEFWDTLMTFEVPDHATEKMVGVLLPICSSPDFEKEMFTSVHEVAGVLCEWVQACAAFARDFVLAGPKFAQLQHEQELLLQAEAQVEQRKRELSAQATSTLEANELRDASEAERQQIEDRLQGSTSTLQMTTAVWKVLESTQEKWSCRHAFYSALSDHWVGDLMLATALVAYTPCVSGPVRQRLHHLWAKALDEHLVAHSPQRRPLHQLFFTNETQLSKLRMDGLPPNDEGALENAVVVLSSYRVPLLLDPYGVAIDWLKKHHEANEARIVAANASTSAVALWKEVETSIKREKVLILVDVSEHRMNDLRSFLNAKRRALFDAMNRDISASSRGRNSGGYRCWCHPPIIVDETRTSDPKLPPFANFKPGVSQASPPVFEFGSDACRVFLVYTQASTVPHWMSAYLSQLSVVSFECSAPFVQARGLHKIMEAQNRLRELTEIHTLEHDMVVCDEQIDGLEDELLDFFCTERPEQVYADSSKALRIVANRSAVNTLEVSKNEARDKVSVHWGQLANYLGVAKRCVDAVWAWWEFNYVLQRGDAAKTTVPLSWVWTLLVRAGEGSSKTDTNLEEVVAWFTSDLEQYVTANLRDEDRLLFKFLLGFRIWQHRTAEKATASLLAAGADGSDVNPYTQLERRRTTDTQLLTRLVKLLLCNNTGEVYQLCERVASKLLKLRPKSVRATHWQALCFMADGSPVVRDFVVQVADAGDNLSFWKELIDADATEADCTSSWQPPVQMDELTRLCIVGAIHTHRLLSEMEAFAARELRRMHTLPAAAQHHSTPGVGSATPAFHTIVAAAAHSAMTLAPDRHRDLFHFWRSFSSALAPLVVFCPPEIDFVSAVEDVSKRAAATMEITSAAEFLTSDAATFKSQLLSAMANGHWVVLPNLHTTPHRFQELDSIYQSLKDGQAHSDFRLWISIHKRATQATGMQARSFEGSWVSHASARKDWGSGFFSLKRSLHHTFAVLKQEMNLTLSEPEQIVAKQIGVFHALVSSRDQLTFAQWKAACEFGDADLCALIRSLLALKSDHAAGTAVAARHQQSNAVNEASSRGVWDTRVVSGVVANIYNSKLASSQDKLLVNDCLDLVLNAWPTAQEGRCNGDIAESGQLAVPEVTYAIKEIAAMRYSSILDAIPHLWVSEACGPRLTSEYVDAGPAPWQEINSLWDPEGKRHRRQRFMVRSLALLLANSGDVKARAWLHSPTKPMPRVSVLLESIATFGAELEGLGVRDEVPSLYEYRQPISVLVRHERQTLESVRAVILEDISLLKRLSLRAQALDPVCSRMFKELQRGCTPTSWLELLHPAQEHGETWELVRFQQHFLRRLETLSRWTETTGTNKVPLDSFSSSRYVLEAVHQHFIRNHVGSVLCGPNCLKTVALYEDSPQLILPVKDDVVYISGLRAFGHLQLEVTNIKSQAQNVIAGHQGIPVVLEVTSGCLLESATPSTATRKASTCSIVSDTDRVKPQNEVGDMMTSADAPTISEFLCPLFREKGGSGHVLHIEGSIAVLTTRSIAQLALSGASLRIEMPA